MSSPLEGEAERSGNRVLAALVDGRRRRILSILLDRADAVDEVELARRVLAAERAESVDAPAPEEAERVRVELRHVHLPELADAGLVAWDEADATAAAAEHPALGEPAVVRLIETEAEAVDDVIASLANDRRRAALGVLAGRDGSVSRFVLARAIAAREGDGDPSTDAIDQVALSLQHVHLPALAEAGLVSYDPEEGTAAFADHPALDAEWLDVREEPARCPGQYGLAD